MQPLTQKILQDGVDWLYGIWPRVEAPLISYQEARIVAHRGVHDNVIVNENTMEAFRLARRLNVWGVELDIRWTKDLVPIVLHDPSARRVFGSSVHPKDFNFREFIDRIPDIPTLEEVVAAFGKTIHLMIEIKSEVFPNLNRQREILKRILSPLKPEEDFHLLILKPELQEAFPDFPNSTYVLVSLLNVPELARIAKEKKLGGLSGHYALLSLSLIKELQGLGIKVGTGFVDSKNVLRRELVRQVDWIFSNQINLLMRLKNQRLSLINKP